MSTPMRFLISLLFILLLYLPTMEIMAFQTTTGLFVQLPGPIRLSETQTEIWVRDFVMDPDKVESVHCSDGFQCRLSDDKQTMKITSHSKHQPYGNLTIRTPEDEMDVLIMKAQSQEVQFTYADANHEAQSVYLVGDMNGWNAEKTPLQFQSGAWSTHLTLKPGVYQYQFVVDSTWMLDPSNSVEVPNGIGGVNSEFRLDYPATINLNTQSFDTDYVILSASAGVEKVFAYVNNRQVPATVEKNGEIVVDLPEENEFPGRSYLRVWVSGDGKGSNDLFVPLESGNVVSNPQELNRFDLHRQIMYFLMVDRFYNADTLNDRPETDPDIHPLANHHGGDIKGVVKKLNDGYFEDLGMNTIWLSPIPKNPEGSFGLWDKGGVRSKFSAYHGYWPISFTKIDDRFGDSEDLKQLVTNAHAADKNVILDFVANHVHELHPVYQKNKDNEWATELYLPDGSLNTERWDDHRLTTWFDVFLPTLNLEKEEITNMLADSAMYWLYEYNLDGFRHDATKHIPQSFWRELTKRVKDFNLERGFPVYQVGETYGSPELISSYIGSGMLDGQFDFNFYDASIASIIRPDVGFDLLEDRMLESFSFYGHHHLMGIMTGNQDKPRFISLASGDIQFDEDSKLAGWTREIENRTPESFSQLAIMHALIMTVPGVPCVYYGDEIGMPGGNDPDNRRMMRFDNLSPEELQLRRAASELAHLRTSHMALMYGETDILMATSNQLAIRRSYFDETVYLLINTSENSHRFNLELDKTKILKTLPGSSEASVSLNFLEVGSNQFKIIITN